MKNLIKGKIILQVFVLLVFCSSCGFSENLQGKENVEEESVSKQDSLSYQKGIEHSVNEKLLKQYKNDKKKK